LFVCLIVVGLCTTAQEIAEAQYLAYGQNNDLRYSLEKRNVSFKGIDAALLFIRESTRVEQAHTKATEEKYKHQVLQTITHDLKTPLTIIKGQLAVLPNYVSEEGRTYLMAAQVSTAAFEYYIYDLIVQTY
jgi:K+-sensing histidine kinase KdpD